MIIFFAAIFLATSSVYIFLVLDPTFLQFYWIFILFNIQFFLCFFNKFKFFANFFGVFINLLHFCVRYPTVSFSILSGSIFTPSDGQYVCDYNDNIPFSSSNIADENPLSISYINTVIHLHNNFNLEHLLNGQLPINARRDLILFNPIIKSMLFNKYYPDHYVIVCHHFSYLVNRPTGQILAGFIPDQKIIVSDKLQSLGVPSSYLIPVIHVGS